MPLDWNKPLQTQSGRPARLLGTLAGTAPYDYRHAVAVTNRAGNRETILMYTDDGLQPDDNLCLVNTPQKHVRWVNVYLDQREIRLHTTKEHADESAAHGRIACIRIEFEDGEGLSNGS